MMSTIGKKLVNLQDSPTCLEFDDGPEMAKPLNFCIMRHCQSYRMDVI